MCDVRRHDNQTVTGILLLNLPGKITQAKRIIQNKTLVNSSAELEKKISVAY